MRFVRVVFLFLFSFTLPSFGNSKCLENFANLEASNLNEQLISQTYLDMLNEVTGDTLSPLQREAIFRSGDPFSVPSELGLESDSLNQSLNQFKDLIQEKYGDIKDLKPLLLNALQGNQTKIIEAEHVQKKSDKKNPILLQTLEWPEAVRDSFFRYRDWFVAMGGQFYHDKKGWQQRKFIDLLKADGTRLSLPFKTLKNNNGIVILAFNELTREFYFADRGTPMKLWKAKIFDDNGNPSTAITFDRVVFENVGQLRENSIDGIYFSPDRKFVLFRDTLVVFGARLTGGANAPLKAEPIWEGNVNEDKNIGYLGNQKIFTANSKSLSILDLDGKHPEIALPVHEGYHGAFGSGDGKLLYLLYYQLGKRPFIEIHDVDALAVNPRMRPEILDLGHKQQVQDFEDGYQDEIVPLSTSQGNLLVHMYVGRKSEKGRHELRVWEPLSKKLVFSTPIAGRGKSEITNLKLSSGGKSIMGTEDLGDMRTKTWIWDVETLIERVER